MQTLLPPPTSTFATATIDMNGGFITSVPVAPGAFWVVFPNVLEKIGPRMSTAVMGGSLSEITHGFVGCLTDLAPDGK
jgi:hypothetical protein